MAEIFGHTSSSDLLGSKLKELIPQRKLPGLTVPGPVKDKDRKTIQRLTGRRNGSPEPFPLQATIECFTDESSR